jgi:hypothetical protein
VTFRGRLVLAATTAVLVVVVLGSLATYLVAYNSLIGSVDANLSNGVTGYLDTQQPNIDNFCATTPGECIQVVNAAGAVDPRLGQSLPVTGTVRSVAASRGKSPDTFFSTTVNGIDIREIVTALPPNFTYLNAAGTTELPDGGALQLTTDLTGVNHELRHLAVALWLIVLVGVTVAVVLGLAVGRAGQRAPQQPHPDRRGAGRHHRRVKTARPRRSRRARPAASGLQPAPRGTGHLAGEPTAVGARRLPRAPHSPDEPADQHGGGPPARGAGP